jgi:hypothetical protein
MVAKIGGRPCSFITDNPALNQRWNPCGMIMDWLPGGAYSRKAICFTDGTIARLLWYPCVPGALAFPFPHAFGSLCSVQTNGFIPPPVGEIELDRRWLQDAQLAYGGQCYSGDPDWYVNGVPPAVLSQPPLLCDYCAAITDAIAVEVFQFVNEADILGGAYDQEYSSAWNRLP